MITAARSRSAAKYHDTDSRFGTDSRFELESLVAIFERIDFGARIPSFRLRPPHSAIRPGYSAKTYNEKNVSVIEDRIIGLPVFSYEVTLSKRFDPKRHFKQFQQFSQGVWHDYALLLLTDTKIGLLDLSSMTLVHTVFAPGIVTDLSVENVADGLAKVEPIVKNALQILDRLDNGEIDDHEDISRTVDLLNKCHSSLLYRTGKTGFFSYKSEEPVRANGTEVKLGHLDLSKVYRNLMRVVPSGEPIYLDAELPLSQAVTTDLTTESDFVIIEKSRRKF